MPSSPAPFSGEWMTSDEYQNSTVSFTAEKFTQVINLLLENPNLNSTHLFRADILHDSDHVLRTVSEKESRLQLGHGDKDGEPNPPPSGDHEAALPFSLVSATLQRTVRRRLIPRKPQLDRVIDQTCYFYRSGDLMSGTASRHLVVLVPHVEQESEMPWYHPPVKALAYLFEADDDGDSSARSSLSVHYLPFQQSSKLSETPNRLHRTFVSLLQTFLRLAKNPAPEPPSRSSTGWSDATTPVSELSLAPSAIKDTILPQHAVQDTYTRLKQTYAADLISRWTESTEPAKHVFEDLSIAAFVIELWKTMYTPATFPGFVDVACGNGVLSYVLLREGYRGKGFDARRRKTWQALDMDEYLDEMVCVPRPFLDTLASQDFNPTLPVENVTAAANTTPTEFHDGLFPPGTFIISNHADELTPWTPLLAALSCPAAPLPFLAIPCCSHALSGAKHRYSPKDLTSPSGANNNSNNNDNDKDDDDEQASTGDLAALRRQKLQERTRSGSTDKSMYGCLTRKVVALAREVECAPEVTLLRIPSTRNIGVVGNRRHATAHDHGGRRDDLGEKELAGRGTQHIHDVIARECAVAGGVAGAARTWIARAQKLQTGSGRGKVNWGRKLEKGSPPVEGPVAEAEAEAEADDEAAHEQ